MENHVTDPRPRGKLMNERIRAMIEIWTKDEPEFHGLHVDFDPIGLWPNTVQRPHPPIYVGGLQTFQILDRVGSTGCLPYPHRRFVFVCLPKGTPKTPGVPETGLRRDRHRGR